MNGSHRAPTWRWLNGLYPLSIGTGTVLLLDYLLAAFSIGARPQSEGR